MDTRDFDNKKNLKNTKMVDFDYENDVQEEPYEYRVPFLDW